MIPIKGEIQTVLRNESRTEVIVEVIIHFIINNLLMKYELININEVNR